MSNDTPQALVAEAEAAGEALARVRAEIGKAVFGQERVIAQNRGRGARQDRHQRMGQPGFEPNLEREPADLPALRALQGSRALHAARIIDHSVKGRQGLEVMMDAELVTLAISNLLDNAAKYSDEHIPIRFELESTDTEVRYRVFNHGRALPRELAEGNFRVFRRSASSERRQAGFGIGLALADHVARAHGGRLDCRHQAGTTCFTLGIPLAPPASGEASR